MMKFNNKDINKMYIGDTIVNRVNDGDFQYMSKHDYASDYLTFEALESGTFTFTPRNSNVISYSTDGGETWTEGNSVEVNSGDKVMWKGTMTPFSNYGIGSFSSTANFDIQGNAMSLLYGDNFKGQTDLTEKYYALYQLFYQNTKVISAENLSLPATTLVTRCYANMFYGCTNLTTAPELQATTLVNGCYRQMFYNCTSLNYIKCLATNAAENNYTYRWVFGVSESGTFIKAASMDSWDTGTSGIPDGWTIENE